MSAANCTTHHYACDCREAMFAEMVEELTELRRRFHNCCLAGGSSPEYVAFSTPKADALIARATDQGEMK